MPVHNKVKNYAEKSDQAVNKNRKLDLTYKEFELLVKEMLNNAIFPVMDELNTLKNDLKVVTETNKEMKKEIEELINKNKNQQTKIIQLEEITKEIDALKIESENIRQSQEFICSKFDDIHSDYEKLLCSNKKQKTELQELSNYTNEMSKQSTKEAFKIDQLDQYGRRENLEFEGVPLSKDEDVGEIVVKLATQLGTCVRKSDISTAHRIPLTSHQTNNKIPKHPTIIARFTNREIRNAIFATRSQTKKITEFPVEGMTKLYINENLTKLRKRLFWFTKQKVKELNYKFVWTHNGNIFIRKSEKTEKILIQSEDDLNQLK